MIHLDGVWKSYVFPKGGKHQIYRDLNLTLPSRTNVGIVGRNGAGKSTLVRLMSGAEAPDRGRVYSDGQVSPPMGLGTGFVQTSTGLENARFVCRLRGDSAPLMRDRVAFIRSFSELGDFFDRPLKTYSTGMRGRLAFAISMAFDYDYYLIDELTSVGDRSFRKRADAAFRSKRDRASIILVSHSMDTLRNWCEAGIYIKDGTVQYFEQIRQAIDAYTRDNS